MSEYWWHVAGAIVPSIALAVVFIFVVRAMISADRRERAADQREDEAGHQHTSAIPTEMRRRDES